MKTLRFRTAFPFVIVIIILLPRIVYAGRLFDIEEMEFKQSQVIDIIRVLSEDSKINIIATPEAGKKEVTVFLKQVNLEEAIKAICRISDLWYRRDEDGSYRLMTKEQYSKDLVVGQDDDIRVFQLRNPNVIAIASAIEDLYGNRVQVSYGLNTTSTGFGVNGNSTQGSQRFGGRRTNRNINRNVTGNRGRRNTGNSFAGGMNKLQNLPDDLTVEQLAELSSGGKQVDVEQLAKVSGMTKLVYVTVNIEHNLLIVKTSDPVILRSITSLVEQLDKPQNQVMLEMKIIDIEVGEDFSSLFNIELTGTQLGKDSTNPIVLGGAAALSGGGSLIYEFVSQNIKANIELLEQNNRINVISNPMLVASNHRPATLFVGEERIMVRGYSIDTIDNLNVTRTITTPETELAEIGSTLEITPHINNDGSIHILLKQENATLNEAAAVIPVTDGTGGVINLPVDTITTARLQGEIFARHGYTVAVGGLIRDSFSRSRRKVPYLADIPVIGNVFRSTIDGDSKSELILLITPYILNQEEQQAQYDPTDKYHRYAPNASFKSMPLPKSDSIDVPYCGDYCSPSNLRRSDL